jgi:hypothetical protein
MSICSVGSVKRKARLCVVVVPTAAGLISFKRIKQSFVLTPFTVVACQPWRTPADRPLHRKCLCRYVQDTI